MANNQWGWPELENKRVNAGILDLLRLVNPIYALFFDGQVIDGDKATYIGKTSNKRVIYHDNIDYSDFKTSVSLKQDLELVHYGCYGDVYSRDFGKMALNEPGKLEEFIKIHHNNAMAELNNDIDRKFKEDVNDDAHFTSGMSMTLGRNPMIIENDDKFYESGQTVGKDNAEIVWESIYANSIKLCRRTSKYNVRGAMSNVGSLKDLIIFYTPKIHSMIQHKIYAANPNPQEVRFEPMFKAVCIMDFSDHKFSTDTPMGRVDTASAHTPTAAQTNAGIKAGKGQGASSLYHNQSEWQSGEYGDWYDSKDHILLLSKDSYKVCDAINPPLYVDNSRLGLSLKTYFFKWFFGFAGFIDFVNAIKWKGGLLPATTTP